MSKEEIIELIKQTLLEIGPSVEHLPRCIYERLEHAGVLNGIRDE